MAPPARPTRKTTKPGPKPKAAAKAKAKAEPAEAAANSGEPAAATETAKPKRTRNQRPKMPVFYEDIEAGTLTEMGDYLGNSAEEVLSSYLGKLDDEEREQAVAAADYAVFTPNEGIVKLSIVPPTEPTIVRR